jgi:hypothetical protein
MARCGAVLISGVAPGFSPARAALKSGATFHGCATPRLSYKGAT